MRARILTSVLALGLLAGCDADPRPLVGFDTSVPQDTGDEPDDTGEEPDDTGGEPDDVATDGGDDVGQPDVADTSDGEADTAETVAECTGCAPGQVCLLNETCAPKGQSGTCVDITQTWDAPADIHGLTFGGKDTYATTSEAACAVDTWTGDGDDAIFKLAVEEGRRYTAEIVASDYRAGLIVRRFVPACTPNEPPPTTPEGGGDPVFADNCYGAALADAAGEPVRVSFTADGLGETWLIVDGAAGESGIFHLKVNVCDDCATHCNDSGGCGTGNSTCEQALPLTLGQPTPGTTAGASDDYYDLEPGTISQPACREAGVAPTSGGPDVAFAYTAEETGQYRFTVSDAAFDTYLMVALNGCTDLSETCLDSQNVGGGTGESVTVTIQAGQTAFAIVDSVSSADSGPFQVLVEAVE